MARPRVEFLAPFAVHSGYAQAAHDTAMAMYTAGIDFSITPMVDCNSDDLDPRYGCLLEKVRAFDNPTHIVVMTIPRYAHEFVSRDMTPPKDVKKICYTTWETDRIDPADAKNLSDHFDAVVLPSGFSRGGLAAGGVPHEKMARIPYGFEPKFWWPEDPPVPPDAPYTFYTINLWNLRKAPIELLKAFIAEFRGSKDKVKLVFCTPDVIDDDVLHLLKCSGLHDLPEVEFLKHDFPLADRRLSETELRNLHYTSHCYVSLSRGEAWALGAFEAFLVGNPVIHTDFGGQTEFLEHYHLYGAIDYFLTPAITPEIKASKPVTIGGLSFTPMKRAVPTGIAGDQNWAEPDISEARRWMRYVYEGRVVRGAGHVGEQRNAIADSYSYKAVGALWKKFLEEL